MTFNVHDASPRVLAEAMCMDVPVLINWHILGGWKYATEQTGEDFYDTASFIAAYKRLRDPERKAKLRPRQWYRYCHACIHFICLAICNVTHHQALVICHTSIAYSASVTQLQSFLTLRLLVETWRGMRIPRGCTGFCMALGLPKLYNALICLNSLLHADSLRVLYVLMACAVSARENAGYYRATLQLQAFLKIVVGEEKLRSAQQLVTDRHAEP